MADEVDVETTLVSLIAGYLYPNGTAQACAANPAPPRGVQVFRGWPSTQAQEAAKGVANASGVMTNQFVNVSVAARNGVERNTARYPFTWKTSVAPVHTLTATVNNNVVTLGGTIAVPQNVIVIVGPRSVAGQNTVFNYAVQANDTLTTIATAVASAINAKFPGTVSNGAVITIASSATVIARITSSGTVLQEVGRQEKSFQISIWAPPATTGLDPDAWRTSVAKIIDPSLKQLVRITLPDNTYAHIHYERTITMDAAEMDGLYRRDLYFWVEYASTMTQIAYEIGAFQEQLTLGQSPTETLPLPAGTPVRTTNS